MAQTCRRRGRTASSSATDFEIFEQMHYACFHYEFEHGDVDVDAVIRRDRTLMQHGVRAVAAGRDTDGSAYAKPSVPDRATVRNEP